MNYKKPGFLFFGVSFVYLVLVMFVLPAFSYNGYSTSTNTTSQLGAQGSPFAWVMNSAFVLMGISIVFAFLRRQQKFHYEDTLPIIFGLCFILVAIFQHEPGTADVVSDSIEAQLHSIFATVMGIVISAYALIKTVKAGNNRDRLFAIIALVSAFGLSFLMFVVPNYAGLFQRAMFIYVLIWLGYIVAKMQPKDDLTPSR